MWLGGTSHKVAWVAAIKIYATDKLEFGEQIDNPIDGHQANTRMVLLNPAAYLSRRKVIMAGRNYIKNSMSLRCKSIPILP
jgi:hypothetical protein